MEVALVTLFINVFNLLKTNAKESISWLDNIRQERDFFGKAVETYCENLKKRCEKLKILNMEKPIELGQIYTSVNVLPKMPSRTITPLSLLEEQLRNDGHFRQIKETTSAIDLMNKQDRHKAFHNIVINGQPGAGKTTFLRYIALRALKGKEGELKREVLPILVELRDLSHSNMTLMQCIEHQFDVCGIDYKPFIERVLSEGNCLILLDGLDEVKKGKAQELVREVKDIVNKYNKNQFVLTCRIAARDYVFERFVDTQIADFNDEQIEHFVNQWFWPDQTEKSVTFLEGLKGNNSIRELATTPLLLALMCMDYGERGVFPSNRATLYKKCLETLLEKWDGTRNIYRDEIYKNLDSIKKELMFARIAATMFGEEKSFLPEELLSKLVGEFIKNLLGTKIEDLDVNSKQVVKAIESQHGIFVERAEGIYSFSHLTFQEYFTAKYVVTNKKSLQHLVEHHLFKIRWKEVILLTSGLIGEADDFLLAIKKKVDSLIDADLGYLLKQIFESSKLFELVVGSDKLIHLEKTFPLYVKLIKILMFLSVARALAHARTFGLELVGALARALDRTLAHAYALAHAHDRDLARDLALDRARAHALDRARDRVFDLQIEWFTEILEINRKIVGSRLTTENAANYNRAMGKAIPQINKFQGYLYGTRLLVECMKSDCYVSKETREKIMSELLTIPERA